MTVTFGTSEAVEIKPGTIAQVIEGRKGQKVLVTDDVQGIANQLREISPDLRLVYLKHTAVYTVEQHIPLADGSVREELVTSAVELDGRLLDRVRQVVSPQYDLAAEIEKAEAAADREHRRMADERHGDMAERLGHALRQDLSRHEAPYTRKSRAFIPPAFKPED